MLQASLLGKSQRPATSLEPASDVVEGDPEDSQDNQGLISGIAKDFQDNISPDTCCSSVCNACFGCETTEAGGLDMPMLRL